MTTEGTRSGVTAFRVLATFFLLALLAFLGVVMHLGYLAAIHGTVHGGAIVFYGGPLILLFAVTCVAAFTLMQWKSLIALVLVGVLAASAVLSGGVAWIGRQFA